MTVTRRITGHWLRACHYCPAKQRGNNECCRILHSGLFISFCRCRVENKRGRIRRVNSRNTIIAVLATLSTSLAFAEDFKTIDGKEYKNATISRVETDGIVLKNKSGITKVYFTELPSNVQKRFRQNSGGVAKQNAPSAEHRLGGTAAQFAAWYGAPNDSPVWT